MSKSDYPLPRPRVLEEFNPHVGFICIVFVLSQVVHWLIYNYQF